MLNQDFCHITLSLSGAPVLVYLHKTRVPVCFQIIYGHYCFYLIVDKDDKHAVNWQIDSGWCDDSVA